jgi:hypothetical protein
MCTALAACRTASEFRTNLLLGWSSGHVFTVAQGLLLQFPVLVPPLKFFQPESFWGREGDERYAIQLPARCHLTFQAQAFANHAVFQMAYAE